MIYTHVITIATWLHGPSVGDPKLVDVKFKLCDTAMSCGKPRTTNPSSPAQQLTTASFGAEEAMAWSSSTKGQVGQIAWVCP